MTQVYCPRCSSTLSTRWTEGRKLQLACSDCSYRGAPYTPPQKPLPDARKVLVGQFHGWHYELYDQYGHAATFSQSFRTRDEAVEAGLDARERTSRVAGYGQCVVLLWPPTVTVHAERLP